METLTNVSLDSLLSPSLKGGKLISSHIFFQPNNMNPNASEHTLLVARFARAADINATLECFPHSNARSLH